MPSTPSSSRAATRMSLAAQVAVTTSWEETLGILCRHHGLGDLRSRHSLRAVHRSYADISRRLNATYHENEDNERIRTGLVLLWCKMCTDYVLRDKLLEEGYLAKIAPLLNKTSTMFIALQALAVVTHHSGNEARREVLETFKHYLLNLILEALKKGYSGDGNAVVTDKCVTILSHAAVAAMDLVDDPSYEGNEGDVASIVHGCTAATFVPGISMNQFNHCLILIGVATYRAPRVLLPPAIAAPLRMLIAAMGRREGIQDRIDAYTRVMILKNAYSGSTRIFTVERGRHVARTPMPVFVEETITKYGRERTEYYMITQTSKEYHVAVAKFLQDRDLVGLGLKLSDLVMLSEYSARRGQFVDEDERPIDHNLPFSQMDELLPRCAEALRSSGPAQPANLDAADCLELKYYLMKGDAASATSLAARAMARSPTVGYFYYAGAAATENWKDSLQLAKYGLKKCGPSTTVWVRIWLLVRATHAALRLGAEIFEDVVAHKNEKTIEEVVACLNSAMEDSGTYVKLAPPDARYLQEMLAEHALLHLVLRGREISPDLEEIIHLAHSYRDTDDILDYFYGETAMSQTQISFSLVMANYEDACAEWDPIIRAVEANPQGPVPVKANMSVPPTIEDVTTYLETVRSAEGGEVLQRAHGDDQARPSLRSQKLYRCSYCGNPTAALRKCSRCRVTRYCGAGCQKSHWTEGHKAECVLSHES